MWDLSHAESRTFRPFEDKTLAREKKKKWGTHYGISDLKFRGKIYGAIVPVDEESHLNHFETCFRDLLQKLEPIQMR